jgi:hypothetical protein
MLDKAKVEDEYADLTMTDFTIQDDNIETRKKSQESPENRKIWTK